MLRLIIGEAGTGKTSQIINEICCAVREKKAGNFFIVPEQYSHEAERELCRACGDSLSLYAEVLSFTGFSRRIMAELGGISVQYLDKGGKLLSLALAMRQTAGQLRCFERYVNNVEILNSVLKTIDEIKLAGLGAPQFDEVSESCEGALGDKLKDIALILRAYDAVIANGYADPSDRLTVLAQKIKYSSIDENSRFYVDGFTDFTGAEMKVLSEIMKKGASLTVTLTLDSVSGINELFSLSRSCARRLIKTAGENGVDVEISRSRKDESEKKDAALALFTESLFSYTQTASNPNDSIEIFRAESIRAECELAASKVLELVKKTGCRMRDIAVAVRGFEDYRPLLESVFSQYGIPLFTSALTGVDSKPLPVLISDAFDIILGGWNSDDIISYLGTGLTGLERNEQDMLSDYVFLWQPFESSWKKAENWTQHPGGYGEEFTAETDVILFEINGARRKIASPLMRLEKACSGAGTASEYAAALAEYLENIKITDRLYKKAEILKSMNENELADETLQLWEICVNAIEQINSILGDTVMETEEFAKLLRMMFTKYDVGTIPVALDRVSAGDFDRMRKRHLEYLIILGADDARLPGDGDSGGIFSDDERIQLAEAGIEISGSADDEIWREYTLMYNCVSLPSKGLIISYPALSLDGSDTRPSVLAERAKKIFGIQEKDADIAACRMSARRPAFMLAAEPVDSRSAAAAKYFSEHESENYSRILNAAKVSRGKLSEDSIEKLYGKDIYISASRADKFYSCRYSYFCQYGLKAKARREARFAAPEIGTFFHYVLENTAREISENEGFENISGERIIEITKKYTDRYIHEELNDFSEKSGRFIWLFKRIVNDVYRVAADMAAELKKSKFRPAAFELDFSDRKLFPARALEKERDRLGLTGIADRVDVWQNGGNAYIRIADYKTGNKKFSLRDIWYGMSMQMLIYLFALEDCGPEAKKALGLSEDSRLIPAGVMYIPARDPFLSTVSNPDEAEIDRQRKTAVNRSGIVLDEDGVPEAWETGTEKYYSPAVSGGTGRARAEAAVSSEDIRIIQGHVDKKLRDMASMLRGGSIDADPYSFGQENTACRYCDYADTCGFFDGENGEHMREIPSMDAGKVLELMGKEAEGQNE